MNAACRQEGFASRGLRVSRQRTTCKSNERERAGNPSNPGAGSRHKRPSSQPEKGLEAMLFGWKNVSSRLLSIVSVMVAVVCPLRATQAQCDSCDSICSQCDPSIGGGLLAGLQSRGITVQTNLTQFYFGNASGGLEDEFRYGGHGDYLANMDLGALGIQEGLFLKVRAEHRFGESISDATGAFLPATLAAVLPVADERELYLTNVLLTQALSETFVLFAGKMDTLDGDVNAFAHGRGIRQFSNAAFVATPLALRTVPYSTLGCGFAFLDEGEPVFSFIALNPTDTAETDGFSELFAEGVSLTSELRLPTQFFGRLGHQLFGGSWSSRTYFGLDQDPRFIIQNLQFSQETGSWSLYWNMDQYIVEDPCRANGGWGIFARSGLADPQTNPIPFFISAGLGGSSPIASRPYDSFGIGYYYSETSNDLSGFLANAFGGITDGQATEFFYNVALNEYITLTPDLQFLMPARTSVDDALVCGLRVNMAF